MKESYIVTNYSCDNCKRFRQDIYNPPPSSEFHKIWKYRITFSKGEIVFTAGDVDLCYECRGNAFKNMIELLAKAGITMTITELGEP